jgi:DNA repair protein SbcC/Rad50
MRPISLHLAGFTAFRQATEIDFEGADLFALTGPTGSGKSSIIDAICFALYGSIPRLSGVAPVVSLGKPEARIRLVFEVEGETYTVSRLIVRQGDGASQRDVRLEGSGLAVEGVREVDARITGLLGLGFDHFTRCVVLPQGRFAAFLEDGPAARERLLKQLLDLGVYEEMRKRGASHSTRLETEMNVIDAQLHDLLVDEAHIAQIEERLERLAAFRDLAADTAAREEKVVAALRDAQQGRDQVVRQLDLVSGIEPPPDVGDLGGVLRSAREAVETVTTALAGVEAEVSRLSDLRTELGELAVFDRAIAAHTRRVELAERHARGVELIESARAKGREAADTLAEAQSAVSTAEAGVRTAERLHAAHAIRGHLVDGDTCPVCLQDVASIPVEDPPQDLDAARQSLSESIERRDDATARLNEVTAELARLEGHLEQRAEELVTAEAAVADLPTLDDIRKTRDTAVALDGELKAARDTYEQARREVQETVTRLAEAEKAGAAAAEALDRARDAVAVLEPPIPGRLDPAADWAALLDWCRAHRVVLEERRTELESELVSRQTEVDELRDSLRTAASEAGIVDPSDDVKVAVATAIATNEATLSRMKSDLEKKHKLEVDRKAIDIDRRRYDETAKLLRSNRFQQWLIEEAMVGLIEFANAELAKLAGGAYSLAVEGGEFEVIDHRNAEARRSVKTLSGGETFLVSLALALALAERVVATSAIGTARIESMFLDEGFGTLDAETLDTVASVVQELGSRDRMLGLVTHVRELADQIPIRFEVRKLPDGATVTRVDT